MIHYDRSLNFGVMILFAHQDSGSSRAFGWWSGFEVENNGPEENSDWVSVIVVVSKLL
jgi:hypothetical protein